VRSSRGAGRLLTHGLYNIRAGNRVRAGQRGGPPAAVGRNSKHLFRIPISISEERREGPKVFLQRALVLRGMDLAEKLT